jgi:hypothetical protein
MTYKQCQFQPFPRLLNSMWGAEVLLVKPGISANILHMIWHTWRCLHTFPSIDNAGRADRRCRCQPLCPISSCNLWRTACHCSSKPTTRRGGVRRLLLRLNKYPSRTRNVRDFFRSCWNCWSVMLSGHCRVSRYRPKIRSSPLYSASWR